MARIRRWWRRGRVVWSEPARPPWLKVNPRGTGTDDDLQPGETTLAMQAQEFLGEPEPGDDKDLLRGGGVRCQPETFSRCSEVRAAGLRSSSACCSSWD